MRALFEVVFGSLDRLLAAIPLAAARWVVVAFLCCAALATLLLPSWFVYLGSPDRSRLRDLRWWSLLIMLPYIFLYALL